MKIRKGDTKSATDVLTDLARIIPTDDEFRTAFQVARVPKSNLARYYLIALEEGHRASKEPEFVPNTNEAEVNLEHVLPKNATEADWGRQFPADERKAWTYRVGNLALLQKGPNGRIGNRPFSIKKPIFEQSGFALTKEVGSEADWTPKQVATRQARLADIAVKVWPRTI